MTNKHKRKTRHLLKNMTVMRNNLSYKILVIVGGRLRKEEGASIEKKKYLIIKFVDNIWKLGQYCPFIIMLMPLLWKEISYCKSEVSKRGKADNVNMLQLHNNLDIKNQKGCIVCTSWCWQEPTRAPSCVFLIQLWFKNFSARFNSLYNLFCPWRPVSLCVSACLSV